MAAADRLTLGDVRSAFRLIGRIREVGRDPDRWRPLMLRRLLRLVGAEVAVSSELQAARTTPGGPVEVIDRGWGVSRDGHRWHIETTHQELAPEDLWLAPIAQPAGSDDPLTVRPLRPLHAGRYFILSQIPLPHAGAVDQLGLHRAAQDAVFTRRDHRLLRVFHLELGRFWREDALAAAGDPAAALPPRLAQTLEALVAGDGEKQIAHRLGLSPHTVHNYIKALHRRFEVSSRGELLAKVAALRQSQGFRPHLCLEAPSRQPAR